MAELANRPLLGYPGASVALHIEGNDTYRVRVTDPAGTREWVAKTKRAAKEMYFHPFVYGYEYPNTSTYEGEDGA